MIVNKYNGGGGSGQRGPQGYQGPEGPQGAQGPAGSGSTGDGNKLNAVSEFPESANTGDVVALYHSESGMPYGILFEERSDLGPTEDMVGGRFSIPLGALQGITEDNALTLGTIICTIGGEPYGEDYNVEVLGNEFHSEGATFVTFHTGDPTMPDIYVSMYVDAENGETASSQMIAYYHFTNPGDEYMVLDVYHQEWNELTFEMGGGSFSQMGIYQYDGTAWTSAGGGDSHILLASSGAPAGLADGDVWAFHGTEPVPVPIDQRFSAVTKTYVAGEAITFHFWAEPWGGRANETAGVTEEGVVWGTWGADNNVITGPWGNHGIEVSFNGSEVTFTTQNPEEYYSVWMCDFNPPITEPQEGWHTYQTVNGENKELARKEDLPESNQLLPTNGGWNQYLRMGGEGPEWIETRQVPYGGAEGDVLKVLGGSNEYGWVTPDDGLVAVSALPITSKDGNVYAYANASGYGIAQAQSAVTQMVWMNYPDTTEVSAGFTQIRVPYTAYSFIVEFVTNNGSEACNLWWHGEDSPNHWDASNLDVSGQVDGEFSVTDPNGTLITSVRSGDYLVVTFANAVTQINAVSNLDIYQSVDAAIYTNAVMSDAVTKIWKGTAAEYADLQSYDNNTFYIIL